ncbi:MAG: Mur ligase family protein [Duncaniella sp.]|jgi:UDP-N-acetylmuramate--alanine ligase|uniref:UDP-N-acetylmuramate--L-alanine ligase n=1 Tax=Duncaniella muricolitica TaxID=2880704 RepID=UPI00244E0F76|nr:Mur ligase family protein [Duncaniella muricolitica]MCX4368589.1 Mur ligase family protein [Duncaniella sp.]
MANNIYFIGAGGIGMAALERYFLAKGKKVAGYDRTSTPLTDALAAEGVDISFSPEADTIPAAFRDPSDTLVIYTPAVPDDLPILTYFRDGGFEIMKRARALGLITRDSKSLCFAGTHGKTTTSSMAAHILHCGSIGCNAFLGGVLKNYDSNFLLRPSSPYTVIEADEYDRSFHHLSPTVAVITATDPDHLDIYGTEEAYLESFAHFTELIQPGGTLIVHEDLKLKPRPAQGVKVYTYSRDKGDFHASYIRRDTGSITFDIVTPRGTIRNVNLGVPVEVNIENAIAAAAAVCCTEAFEPEVIRTALSSYQGTKRRFESWLKERNGSGRVIIDDYAHHPEELRSSIASVKALYPGRHLTVAFQPHLYSRTRDFADGFADALSAADSVILLDIYPAREEPIEGVTSDIIFRNVKSADKILITKEKLVETLKNRNFDILLTAGAGDICNYLPDIVRNITE